MGSVFIGFCLQVVLGLPFQHRFDVGDEVRQEIANLLCLTVSTATLQPSAQLTLIAPAVQSTDRLFLLDY